MARYLGIDAKLATKHRKARFERRVVAIGELGLDLFRDTNLDE